MIFNAEKKKIIERLTSKKDLFLSLLVFVSFLLLTAKILSEVNPLTEEIPMYGELVSNPYEKYENLVKRANVKKIIDSEQFTKMKYDDNLVEVDIENIKKREDIFSKMF